MAICQEGQGYKDRTRADFLLANQNILDTIHKYLFPDAIFVRPSTCLEYHFRNSGKSLRVGPNYRVIELEDEDLIELENNRFPPGSLRGEYNPTYGKIILNRHIWCVETLFHEFLHATSSSSYNSFYVIKYRDFYEGLTELYSGYLMKQIIPDCYNKCWRTGTESYCYHTYEKHVKIWLGLCHFIPMKHTYQFYFYKDKFEFKKQWEEFINSIHSCGYTKFKNIIEENKKPLWLALHQECNKNFGKEYLKIYDDILNPVDLSLLKI